MSNLPIKKIYCDTKFRRKGSKSTSNFKIDLEAFSKTFVSPLARALLTVLASALISDVTFLVLFLLKNFCF